jgi:hypothetical protein
MRHSLVQQLSGAESAVVPVKDGHAYARAVAAMHRDDPPPHPEILARVETIERSYPIYDMNPSLSSSESGANSIPGSWLAPTGSGPKRMCGFST